MVVLLNVQLFCFAIFCLLAVLIAIFPYGVISQAHFHTVGNVQSGQFTQQTNVTGVQSLSQCAMTCLARNESSANCDTFFLIEGDAVCVIGLLEANVTGPAFEGTLYWSGPQEGKHLPRSYFPRKLITKRWWKHPSAPSSSFG